ncbi:MAG: STAS domain-containing protein [Gammaproteobacteria bacterium]|nr:STAS domain-containing protein [Gammaproteobacteria bacterium]
MANNSNIELKNNSYIVRGELDFTNVNELWKQSLPLLAKETQLNFDFTHVGASNSAGIALLIEWIKYANKQNKKIHFVNIPAQLQSIINVSGIENIL